MSDWRRIYELEPITEKTDTMSLLGYTPNAFDDINSGTNISKSSKNRIDHDAINGLKNHLYQQSQSPIKSVVLNFFMLYMAPGGLSIITIGMVLVLITNTFKDLLAINIKFGSNFSRDHHIDPFDLILMKIVYTAGCLVNLGVAMWKLNGMGLLPTKTSDWLHWELPLSSEQNSL